MSLLTDSIELRNEHATHGSEEAENVASPRVVVRCVALREELHARVDAVFADSLDEYSTKFFSRYGKHEQNYAFLSWTLLFIFQKPTTSFSLFTSSTFHKKGATWRILGAPTILAMAEDKLALNPPKYLDFGIIHVLQVAFANWVAPQPSGEADVGHCHLVLPRTKRALSILRIGYVIFVHIFSLYSKCIYVTVLNQHLLPVPSVSQLS